MRKLAEFLSRFRWVSTKGKNEKYFGFFVQYEIIGDNFTRKAAKRMVIRKMFLIWEGFGITKYWRIKVL